MKITTLLNKHSLTITIGGNMPKSTQTFDQRLEAAREAATGNIRDTRLKSNTAINYELKKDSQKIITSVLYGLYDHLNMDGENLDFAIKMSRRSEYGRISELITHVAKVYAWPIDDVADVKDIDGIQEELLEYLATEHKIELTHDLLLDIKEAKGNHSFLTKDTYEIVDGVEPEYENLGFYIETFAEYASMPIIDYKLTESQWDRNERKAISKINKEHEAATKALEQFSELQSA